VLNFTHFDVWAYGTNFFTVDWLKATNGKAPPFGTPAAPCDAFDPPGTERCAGFTEIYGLFRSTLGLNQLTGTKMFAAGPLTNIELVVGSDLNTDNTTLGSAKRSIQGGLQFDFATPYKGFFNVGVFAYKEWQNDGFAALFAGTDGKVDFDTTWAVEMLYVQPLGFIPSIPLTYKALVVIHGDKGCGEVCGPIGPGLVRTTEYLTQQTLALDLGQLAWNQPGKLSVWAAYRYWKNKFGIDPNQPGFNFGFTTESTWITGLTVAF
jgi:nucleoside-specific outer membrane channel protein Tsx